MVIFLVNRLAHTSSVGLLMLNYQKHLMLNCSSFKAYGTAENFLHEVPLSHGSMLGLHNIRQ